MAVDIRIWVDLFDARAHEFLGSLQERTHLLQKIAFLAEPLVHLALLYLRAFFCPTNGFADLL